MILYVINMFEPTYKTNWVSLLQCAMWRRSTPHRARTLDLLPYETFRPGDPLQRAHSIPKTRNKENQDVCYRGRYQPSGYAPRRLALPQSMEHDAWKGQGWPRHTSHHLD